jgi:ribosome recycling factor
MLEPVFENRNKGEDTMSQELLKSTREHMQKSVDSFTKELANVRTGRANASILDIVKVEYYGFPTPLVEIASVTVPEPSVIMIKPYEKEALAMIVAAINKSNIGMVPNNDGTVIRLKVPALTEERRKEFVKLVGKLSENTKVAIRNIRRNNLEIVKKDKSTSEDARKRFETDIQKVTDEFIKKIDVLSTAKEKEIMTI